MVAHELVHGVVTAHVLAQGQQLSGRVEEAGGVEGAGALELVLGRAQPVGQAVQGVAGHLEVGQIPAGLEADLVDARLAADAAAGGGVEVALDPAPSKGTPSARRTSTTLRSFGGDAEGQ